MATGHHEATPDTVNTSTTTPERAAQQLAVLARHLARTVRPATYGSVQELTLIIGELAAASQQLSFLYSELAWWAGGLASAPAPASPAGHHNPVIANAVKELLNRAHDAEDVTAAWAGRAHLAASSLATRKDSAA